MIWEIPNALYELIIERALGSSMVGKSRQGDLPKESLAKAAAALAELSGVFTAARDKIKHRYLDEPNARIAYLLYYLPANVPKMWYVLDELARHPGILKNRKELRILDLGAGVGTSSIAALWYFAENLQDLRHLKITAVDNAQSALSDCRWFIEKISQRDSRLQVVMSTDMHNVQKYAPEDSSKYDLIVLSNSLNELFRNSADPLTERSRFLDRFCRNHLADDGSLIMIEPALSTVSRAFHIVRNQLIEMGWHAYSPCVSDRNCPMLLRDRDWCHQVLDWHRPPIVRQLDEMIGNRKQHLKFSYLVLRKDQLRVSDIYQSSGMVYRAVGDLQREKGKDMIYLCGSDLPLAHTLLKRDRTAANSDFTAIERGDLIEIIRNTEGQGERLNGTDSVNILSR